MFLYSLINYFSTLIKIGNYRLPQKIKYTPDDKQFCDLFLIQANTRNDDIKGTGSKFRLDLGKIISGSQQTVIKFNY